MIMGRRYDLGKLGTVLAVLTNRVTKDMRCVLAVGIMTLVVSLITMVMVLYMTTNEYRAGACIVGTTAITSICKTAKAKAGARVEYAKHTIDCVV